MIPKKIAVVALLILAIHVFCQEKSANIKLTAEKLHSRVREWPYPVNGITVPTNAPALLWPGTNGKEMVKPMESGSDVPEDPNIGNVRYKVMLASDKNFNNDLLSSSEQRWAVYPLHQALRPGKWYWKYGYALKGSNQWTWSAVYDFVVDAKYANEKVSPPISEVLKRNEGSHPLLWGMNRIGEDFYRNNLDNPEAKKFIVFAEKLMLAPLPTEKPQRVIDTTGKTPLEKKIIIERMYHGFGDAVGNPVRNLCIAYQLTKDKRFILDAKRRALNIANMNPDGVATRDDFTSGAVLEALGWFYDAGYDFLTPQEKEQFKNSITIRAKRVYNHLPNRFELHVSDNHVWQITLRNLAIATVAVINDVPEAKEWLTYMYEVWSARFPVLGTTDGGWHEGNGYFRVNFKSIIYLSQMFGDFSGVDYFKLPWMQNLPYYMLYTHPNGAATTAIGDMWENVPYIVKGEAWFADALTYRMNNPYLNDYVNGIKRYHPDYFHGTDDFLFFRLLNYKPNRELPISSPTQLPKTRKFADVGVVAMHENLAKANKSISSYLFSSPFGSSGHGHASQNAFTINFKGKVLFGGTGYYSNFSDKHNLLYYRTSKAYNTILADSLNQKIGEEGYGWIPRAISGQRIQYALGDASNAYGEIKSDFWLDRFKQIKLVPSKENGYGESGVTLYRRHLLQLDGGYIILYDELEANKPVKWTTQFHCPYYTIEGTNAANANQQNFTVKTDLGNVTASVFANTSLKMNIHNKFFEPAVNWNKVTNDEGQIKDFKDQWHAGITSEAKQKFRYLTIIQVKDGKTEVIKTLSNKRGLTHVQVGDWDIQAQLDGEKTAALQVIGKEAKSLFNYGDLAVFFQGKVYKSSITGSSLLLEMEGSKLNKQEAVDELPDVAKYDRKLK
ncbi:Heparinase II/III-like protein [Flavobacterium glycines]|uniref:Heparinase n=1 Tax=Flavobacterium glycines TaxID=551990 RepID=A0A1B9DGZ6_9FLAO|nr:DUF4962 domain-containing protein [Flavobacterium glycines]OCB68940.1 heparinase [Flavobacterium glycines]GEL11136.1 heparinase [Flavobacterium glycines]SDJ27340.1 Heparinase II/III-like protein [Flavobacterium glycines]